MSDVEVRPIRGDEIRAFMQCVRTAFHSGTEVDDAAIEYFLSHVVENLDRCLGAFLDGSLRGTTGSFAAELTVPGNLTVPMSAVTQVTVLPTHRRRGLLREMMQTQLTDARSRGELVAMLVAAEWPIYGRFGYGMAVEAVGTVVDARSADFRDAEIHGTLEVVDLPTLRQLAPPIFDAHRRCTPGAIARDDKTWDRLSGVHPWPGDDLPKRRVRVLHRDATGSVDGYVVYDTGGDWVDNRPNLKLDVRELIATNDEAYVDLWRFLCAVDWVATIRAHMRPLDEDIRPLFVDGRAAVQVDRSDHMWVRLLDVPAALAARRYEVPVSVVIDVRDDVFGDGRYRLEGDAGGATCRATDQPADLALGVDVLGAAYLGGTPLHPHVTAGRIEETTTGSVAALGRSMRASRAPWSTTSF